MPTTTTHGFKKPASDLEAANGYTALTDIADSVESVMCPAYTNVTYNGAWTDFGTPYEEVSYAKEGHRVQLRGTAKHATGSTTGTVFTLPTGYRPTKDRIFIVAASVGAAIVTVSSAGVVAVAGYLASGTAGSLPFDDVDFDTAA